VPTGGDVVVRGSAVLPLACAMLIAAVLAGCSSGAPKPSSLPSTSASPAPSRTSATPTPQAEPTGRDAASARAFVRYWVRELNRASATGDTAVLYSLGRPSCASCNRLVKRIRRVYDAKGQIEGTGWRVEKIKTVRRVQRGAVVAANLRLLPQRVTLRAGARSVDYSGGQLGMTFRLASVATRWRVLELERDR
jgi:hypothetical protein